MSKPNLIERKAARAQGLKWCPYHEKFEPTEGFAKSNAKCHCDGLYPVCRSARLERDRERARKKREALPPKPVVPEGKKWCSKHGQFCDKADFGADKRKKDGLCGSCRRAYAESTKAKDGRRRVTSKYNPAPSGTKWCSYHKQFEPIENFTTSRSRCIEGHRLSNRPLRRAYAKNNRGKSTAATARYRASRIQATPSWIDQQVITDIYERANKLSEQTGERYDVDHQVPLRSKWVCGLHVPWNLKIVPKLENLSKGNRHWPGMPAFLKPNQPPQGGFFMPEERNLPWMNQKQNQNAQNQRPESANQSVGSF